MRIPPSSRFFALALLVAGCSDSTEPAPTPVSQIVVAGLPDSVGLGDQLTLQASARGSDGGALAAAAIAWRSLAPGVATVTPAGVVTAVATGDARLVVTATLRGTREDTALVRVRLLPRDITFTLAHDSIGVFDTVRVAAGALDGLGRPMTAPVSLASADTSRAVVDDGGLVRPRGYGTVWLRATAGSHVDSVALRIAVPPVTTFTPWPTRSWGAAAPGGFSTQGYALCALDAGGLLSCGFSNAPTPTSMGTTALRTVANGYRQACGLAADSTAYCVGSNAEGEFGLGIGGAMTMPSSPTLVAGTPGRKWRRLELGDNRAACGIQAADSVVYCWGLNDNGQVGRLPASRSAPDVLPFASPLKAKHVDVGYFSGCAIALDDALWCWGEPLAFQGSFAADVVPTPIAPAGSYVDVAIGGLGLATCALKGDGSVWCWGDEVEQVAVGTAFTPRRVASPVTFARLVGGTSAATLPCGLTADGALHCFARLPGSVAPVALPRVPSERFRDVRLGHYLSCGTTTDGRTLCW